jgi:hypothetical protein
MSVADIRVSVPRLRCVPSIQPASYRQTTKVAPNNAEQIQVSGMPTTLIDPGFVSIAVTADKGQRTGDELFKFFIIKFAEQHLTAFSTARTMECLTFFLRSLVLHSINGAEIEKTARQCGPKDLVDNGNR